MVEEMIEKEVSLISDEMEQMNEEILFLRHEVADLWWSQNGWKFKDKNKNEIFRFCKEAYKAMCISSRKGQMSEDILTEYFLGHRKAKDDSVTNS
jgi:hypothetical protein